MREIVHLQAGQCGNQIGAKVSRLSFDVDIGFYIDFVFFARNLNRLIRILRLRSAKHGLTTDDALSSIMYRLL